MHFNSIKTSMLLATACLGLSGFAAAGPVIQATSVTTDMGVFGSPTFDLVHLIEQDGLSSPYTNGVTDFDSYVPGTTHIDELEEWRSVSGTTTGVVTFDFGTIVSLDALAIWNSSWQEARQVSGDVDIDQFELSFDNDNDIGNGDLGSLGSFNAAETDQPHPSQIFNFAATPLQYLHMEIQSNHGGSGSGFAGVVFRSAPDTMPIPEPGTLALLGLGLVGMGFSRGKKRT